MLPTHDYYKVKQREIVELKRENQKDLLHVMDSLEQVVELMDLEELARREVRRREEEAMRLIRDREGQMRREEEERAATQELIDRLNMLDNLGVPSGVVEKKVKTVEEEFEEWDEEGADDSPIGSLPMPIPFGQTQTQIPLPLPQPPSYDSVNQGGVAPAPAPPPPSYDALMQKQPSQSNLADYRMDSIQNLRPSSSRSLQGMPSTRQDMIDSDMTTFINPLGKFIGIVFVFVYLHEKRAKEWRWIRSKIGMTETFIFARATTPRD